MERVKKARMRERTNLDLLVEAPRSPQRRVDRIWSIGRSNDHDLGSLTALLTIQSVHQCQQRRHDPSLHLSRIFSLRRQSVNLVDDDDAPFAGRCARCRFKDLA